jgi:TetR/AcrR family fatty acid metabolism transcriptional regulator
VIVAAGQMFHEAQKRGELPAHLEPTLCATMLFGAIEMGLTTFVMGLLDKRDEAAIERARDQITETFLHGLTGAKPQPQLQSPPPTTAPRSRSTS